jgi:hypothetical protein
MVVIECVAIVLVCFLLIETVYLFIYLPIKDNHTKIYTKFKLLTDKKFRYRYKLNKEQENIDRYNQNVPDICRTCKFNDDKKLHCKLGINYYTRYYITHCDYKADKYGND